ncbi:MAG: acyltransferase [Terracidiphilus sp.]
MYLLLPLFKEHGSNIWFDPDGVYSFENIILGSDVFLGLCPTLIAAKSVIRIGNKVMFGPQVTVVGGRHNTAEIGRFMTDVTEKRPEDDLGVVIEDDVWVGTRAVILRGVTVGRGSIVAAGSVVTKNVPPYAIVAGCPARVIKFRWDVESLIRHEEMLYSLDLRIPEDKLKTTCEAFAGVERP